MFLLSMVLIALIGVFVISGVLTYNINAKAKIFTAQSTINNEEPFKFHGDYPQVPQNSWRTKTFVMLTTHCNQKYCTRLSRSDKSTCDLLKLICEGAQLNINNRFTVASTFFIICNGKWIAFALYAPLHN